MSLDLQKYWENRGPGYTEGDVVGVRILQTFIEKIAPESLIEVGCGNGILFRIYRNVPHVVGIDFSETMLKRAEVRIQRHEWKHIHLLRIDIADSKMLGLFTGGLEKADLVVTRTCLMHIDPDNIATAIANVSMLANQALVFEYDEQFPKKLSPHNWLHHYVPLFEGAGFKLKESYSRMDLPQTLFWFKRKEVEKPEKAESIP